MSTVYFNLRIDEELNEAIIRIAQEEGRSKNKQIEQILKEYVKRYKAENPSIARNQSGNNNATVNIDTNK